MTGEKAVYGPFSIDDEDVEDPSLDDENDGYDLNRFAQGIQRKHRRKRALIFFLVTVFVVLLSVAFRTSVFEDPEGEQEMQSSTPSSSLQDELKKSADHASTIKKNLSEKNNVLDKKTNQALDLSSFESKPENPHNSEGKYSNLDHDPLNHHQKPGMIDNVKQSQVPGKNEDEDEDEDEDEFQGASYKVIEEIDRDSSSFTQGLTYADGVLYESAGLYGESTIRRLDPQTGEIIQKETMDRQLFAEGMAYYGEGSLIQITWKKQIGFIYDAKNLNVLSNFTFSTTRDEGWGITYDESTDSFIVSDGSDILHFWDRETLEETRKVQVTHPDGRVVKDLNELEFWNGFVLSNVWYQDRIYLIDPTTGNIMHDIDFSTLWPKSERSWRNDVFNGISITDVDDELFITGKKWPKIYRIRMNVELLSH